MKIKNKHKMNRFLTINFLKWCLISLIIVIALIFLNTEISNNHLAKFAEITADNPLFYDPNMDGTKLEKTVTELKKIDDKILAANQNAQNLIGNSNSPYPPGWRIWPDYFLLSLVDVNKATNSFLKSPTFNNASALLESYKKSSKEYKNAINLNIKAMEKTLKDNPKLTNKQIIFLGSATTPQIIYDDFLLIGKNAQALEEEVNNRINCLKFGRCDVKIVHLSKQNPEGIKIKFDPLPNEVLGIDKKNIKVYGPYFATTGCFGLSKEGRPYSYPFYVAERRLGKDKLFPKPLLTNNKYYRDYTDISKRSSSDLLINSGVVIRPHPETNDYMCTDFRYYPQIIIQYLKAKGKLSNKEGTNNLATLPYIIENALNFNDYLLYNIKYSQKPYPPYFLLSVRTAYSIYFGTFSSAIWRISDTPQFLIHKDFQKFMPESMYLTYKDLKNRGYSDEEITKLNSVPRINDVFRDYFEK